MNDDPAIKGDGLSTVRSKNAKARWTRPMALVAPPKVEPVSQPALFAMDPPPAKTPTTPKKRVTTMTPEETAQRLCDVTNDAIAAFNRILAKPNGRLAKVMGVNIEQRRLQVNKAFPVAQRICRQLYGSPEVPPLFWEQYFTEVKKDPFKSGYGDYSGTHAGWMPSFEYLTRSKQVAEVFEEAMSRG